MEKKSIVYLALGMIVAHKGSHTEIAFSLEGDPDFAEGQERKPLDFGFLTSHSTELTKILGKIEQSGSKRIFTLAYSLFNGDKSEKITLVTGFDPAACFVPTLEFNRK
jgi:hypothetical protein